MSAPASSRREWVSDDCTEGALYVPEVAAVRYTQFAHRQFVTVWQDRETVEAILALFPAADAEAKRPRERCCDNCRWWRPIPCRDYGKCDAPLSLTYPAADEGCTRWEARS